MQDQKNLSHGGVCWDLTQIIYFLFSRKVNIYRVFALVNYLFKFD